MTAAFTINLRIQGSANVSLLGVDTIYTTFADPVRDTLESWFGATGLQIHRNVVTATVALVVLIVAIVLLDLFFRSEVGVALRATGANRRMSRAQGIDTRVYLIGGVALSNALIAVSGALVAQHQGFADVNSGAGLIIAGLAAVIIGEVLFAGRSQAMWRHLVAASLGMVAVPIGDRRDAGHRHRPANGRRVAPRADGRAPGDGRRRRPPARRSQVAGDAQPDGAPMTTTTRRCCASRDVALTFNPGRVNEAPALRKISLDVERGQFVVIVGSNGAGKSTLLNVIAGEHVPDGGTIELGGRDVTRVADYRRARWIGRVFQDPLAGTAGALTIHENLMLAERRATHRRLRIPHNKAQHRELLAVLGMGLEDRLTSRVDTLSGGQRQALTVLMATQTEPDLLMLDEHTAALDPAAAERVLDVTRQLARRGQRDDADDHPQHDPRHRGRRPDGDDAPWAGPVRPRQGRARRSHPRGPHRPFPRPRRRRSLGPHGAQLIDPCSDPIPPTGQEAIR